MGLKARKVVTGYKTSQNYYVVLNIAAAFSEKPNPSSSFYANRVH